MCGLGSGNAGKLGGDFTHLAPEGPAPEMPGRPVRNLADKCAPKVVDGHNAEHHRLDSRAGGLGARVLFWLRERPPDNGGLGILAAGAGEEQRVADGLPCVPFLRRCIVPSST